MGDNKKLKEIGRYLKYIASRMIEEGTGVPYPILKQNIISGIKGSEPKFFGSLASLSQYLVKLLAFLFITLYAFFPETVVPFFWAFLIIFIVLIVITIILIIFFPQAFLAVNKFSAITGENPIISTIISIGIILFILIFTVFLPSPNYNKLLGMKFGLLSVYLFFFVCISISFVFPILKFPAIVIAGLLYLLFLYYLVPLLFFFLSKDICTITYSIVKIPYIGDIYNERVCKPKLLSKYSLVKTGKEIIVPSEAGIYVNIGLEGEMPPLPAGESYSVPIILINRYDREINILDFNTYLKSSYYNLIFLNKGYSFGKSYLKPGEPYGEKITFDPENLKISSSQKCLWTAKQLKDYGSFIDCAYDVPCNDDKSYCVKTDYLECRCVNWINATCSGEPLRVGIDITHSGFFTGKGILYYLEEGKSSYPPYYRYSQGPVEVTFNFIPNPWIQKMYSGYIDKIDMLAKIQFYGYEPKITGIYVEPRTTSIIVKDEENGIITNETIGVNLISCVSTNEINSLLESTGAWSGILCSFTPPLLNLQIVNISTNETIFNSSISLLLIKNYCNASIIANQLNISNQTFNITSLEKFMEYIRNLEAINSINKDIRETINDYGLCGILTNLSKRESKTEEEYEIEKAMKNIEVGVSFDYIITEVFTSREIYPYYTSKCEYEKIHGTQ